MPRTAFAVAFLLVVALACWGSYRHGRAVEAGQQALQRQADIVATAAVTRADALAQAHVDTQATRRTDAAASRVRAIDSESARLPLRPECDWTADELRLAAARHCARYASEDPACSLPGSLQPSADAPEPKD